MAESRKSGRARHTVTATEAAKNFGRLVNRVREDRTTYVVERGGAPVAEIAPVARRVSTFRDLKAWIADQTRPRADKEYLRIVEDVVRSHNKPRVPRNPWER